MLNKMYVIPIRKYTDCIHSADVSPERKKGTYSSIHNLAVKVVPQGSLEVIEFGTAFNMLTDTVYEELYSRKQAEEIMRRARNEAEIANQAKSIFLANMSHELRTPLNAVNGYSELLLETELSEKQESYVGGIRYSSDSLLRLINDILDFSKFESGRLILEHKDFRLEDMLKEVSCVIEILSLQKGIDFDAYDGKEVDLVAVLISPEESGEDHLQALAAFSRILKNAEACKQLRQAKTAHEIYTILHQ